MKSTARHAEITRRLRALVPLASYSDFIAMKQIASAGHLRHLPLSIAAWQAITTHIRHNHTDYDALLAEGYDAESARYFVLNAINEKLAAWDSEKRIEAGGQI